MILNRFLKQYSKVSGHKDAQADERGHMITDTANTKELEERFKAVREKIKTGSCGREVILLAATKTVSADVINYAIKNLSLKYIGENKVQELLEKYPYIEKEGISIHFIGGLQTNKVRQIIDKVDMIQSLDSIKLAEEINKRAAAIGKIMPVLIEINIGREAEKGGVFPEDAESLIKEASKLKNIKIEGLMTMAPAKITEKEYEMYFTEVRELYEKIKEMCISGVEMKTLSMGMSDSFEAAVRCGANLVRVGSALFGRREYAEKSPVCK